MSCKFKLGVFRELVRVEFYKIQVWLSAYFFLLTWHFLLYFGQFKQYLYNL